MTGIDSEHTLAIVNPAAGDGAGARVGADLAHELESSGFKLEIIRTPAPGEAARIAREASADGCRTVIAVGGDGTANEIANGLVGTGTALALYPIGSGNDFARALGYPRKRRDIARFLAGARRRVIDVGEVNGRIFVNAAGVGIDGHVAERVEASARVVGPALGYFVGALVSIATYRPQPMRLQIDGQALEGKHLLVVAANGTHFGSGMHVAPKAKVDDGLFDIVVAGDLGRWSSLVALAKLYRGTHVNGRDVLAFRGRSLDVELERELPAQADGEPLRARSLSVRMRAGELTVLGR
ncbi:MAG TPA: diacylglycerol kinase family protein [Candidatus Limnocylindria bacterium]|nr:diacylglycerol kinase family protein [Candidatus Limnocylindria bacterium]